MDDTAAVATLSGDNPSPLGRQDRLGQRFELPSMSYERGRWSTTRAEKVEAIRNRWDKEPNFILILEDPKFGGEPMVLLRQHLLAEIVRPLDSLQSGQAALKVDITVVKNAVLALKKGLSSILKRAKNKAKGNQEEEALIEQLESLVHSADTAEVSITQLASASIWLQKPARTESAPLSEEEHALAEELAKDAEEEPDDADLDAFLEDLERR